MTKAQSVLFIPAVPRGRDTRVFMSYSRDDLRAAQQLEGALQAHDIAGWRDQESIYSGQQWPQAIGEAIAAHDCLLLVWSKSAARLHFVEFE
jgi:hypothetical protein